MLIGMLRIVQENLSTIGGRCVIGICAAFTAFGSCIVVTIQGSRVNHPGNVTCGTAAATAATGTAGADVTGCAAEAAGTATATARCHIDIRARVLGGSSTSTATRTV